MIKRFVFAIAIGLAVVGLVSADDNVRAVQALAHARNAFGCEPPALLAGAER
jgi:hypothetical protein